VPCLVDIRRAVFLCENFAPRVLVLVVITLPTLVVEDDAGANAEAPLASNRANARDFMEGIVWIDYSLVRFLSTGMEGR
jgi:hypothetical protein